MGRIKKGWYERVEEKKVTLDWLATNCNLTQRESELLQLVYQRKLVRRDHLEIISPTYRYIQNNRTILLNRAITKLFRQMIFDKIHEPQKIGKGNTSAIVAIDRGGSILLNVKHKQRILHSKSKLNGETIVTRRLPSNYKHINGINQMEVNTILFCNNNNHILGRWEHELSCNFINNQEKTTFIPDVLLEIAFNNGKTFLGFLEYDTGSEDSRNKNDFPTIGNKLRNYRRYFKSDLWRELDLKYFPVILLVTEDDKRIEWFNNKCKELQLKGVGVYHENFTSFLEHLAKM